jgi:hypothetical protein
LWLHRAAEANLYAARGDELHDLGTVLHLDIEGDVRIAGAEVLQKVRQIILAGHRGGRDGDRTLHLLREVAQRDGRVLAHLQDLFGVFVEELARVGGVGLLRGADDELDIQFSLQCGDVRADGRLRQVQRPRRPRHASFLRDGKKITEYTDFQNIRSFSPKD